jgi:uncharacterized membrane protein YdjX (TVP38/TMEM64 family)
LIKGGLKMKKMPVGKLIGIVVVFVAVIFGLYKFGVFEYISIENIQKLKGWINGFGIIAPLVYIGLYIIAALFFLPGLPVSLLAGIAFGPLLGALYADIGATLGATAAFLVARYAARGMVEGWAQSNEQFRKIDEGVEKQGWRMLMITRLVPLFPYNVQNFAYGLTKINVVTFMIVSFICMLPGAVAFTFMAGAIVAGESPMQILIYLSIGAVLLVGMSLIPGYLQKKKGISIDK